MSLFKRKAKKNLKPEQNKIVYPPLLDTGHLLFTGRSGAGKTASGCFTEIMRAIEEKKDIYVFSRDKEYNYTKHLLSKNGYSVQTFSLCENQHKESIVFNGFSNSAKAIFFENPTAFTTEDTEKYNQYFDFQLKFLLKHLWAHNPLPKKLIIIDGLDFYKLPDWFWSYFREARLHGIRFIFTCFQMSDIKEYQETRHPEYKQLYQCNRIQIGPFSIRDYNDIQKYSPGLIGVAEAFRVSRKEWKEHPDYYYVFSDSPEYIFRYETNTDYLKYLRKESNS